MLGEWVTGSAIDCYDYYSTMRWNLKTWTLHFCVFVFVFTSELERHSHWSKSWDKSWDASRRLQWPEGSTSRSSSLHTQTQKNKVGREKTKLSWVGRVPCACKLSWWSYMKTFVLSSISKCRWLRSGGRVNSFAAPPLSPLTPPIISKSQHGHQHH